MQEIKKHLTIGTRSKTIVGAIFVLLLLLSILLVSSGCSRQYIAPTSNFSEQFNIALDLLNTKDYSGAKESFTALLDELEQVDRDSNIIKLLADTEFAAGAIEQTLYNYEDAYDHFMSAEIYYRDLLGTESPEYLICMLRMIDLEAEYLDKQEQALRELMWIIDTGTPSPYYEITQCRYVDLLMAMDNRSGTEENLPPIYDIANSYRENQTEILSSIRNGENVVLKDSFPISMFGYSVSDIYLYAFRTLFNYYIKMNDPDKAIGLCHQALEVIESDLDFESAAWIDWKERLGFAYLYFKGEAYGNTYLEDVKNYIDSNYPEGPDMADCYVSLGEMYLSLGQYDILYDYLSSALEIAIDTVGETNDLTASIYVLFEPYYNFTGDYQKAVWCCERAVDIKKAILKDNTFSLGNCYNTLANSYATVGEYENAIDAFNEAVRIFEYLGDDLQLAVTKRNMALIQNNSLHQHYSALKNAREAISLIEHMDTDYYGSTISAIYTNMVAILETSDWDYRYIEDYLDIAYAHLENAIGNTDEYVASYYYYRGQYYYDVHLYRNAAECFSETEALFSNIYSEEKYYPVNIFFDIGKCYYGIRENDLAINYLNKAVEYADERLSLYRNQGIGDTSYLTSTRSIAMNYLNELRSNSN